MMVMIRGGKWMVPWRFQSVQTNNWRDELVPGFHDDGYFIGFMTPLRWFIHHGLKWVMALTGGRLAEMRMEMRTHGIPWWWNQRWFAMVEYGAAGLLIEVDWWWWTGAGANHRKEWSSVNSSVWTRNMTSTCLVGKWKNSTSCNAGCYNSKRDIT